MVRRRERLTVFHPSGSKNEVIFVLRPGIGPGCRVIFPPTSCITWLTTSALLYTSSVPIAICYIRNMNFIIKKYTNREKCRKTV